MLSDGVLRTRYLSRDGFDAAAMIQLDFQRRVFRKGAGPKVNRFTDLPGASFTRASSGYVNTWRGLLKPIGSGALRNTDRGALFEPAATNLLTQSQSFDNATWQKIRLNVIADAGLAPDGTPTADRLIVTGDVGDSQVDLNHAPLNLVGRFNFSLYIRPVGVRRFQLDDAAGAGWIRASFDLVDGVVVTNDIGANPRIVRLADGWFRISCDTVLKGASAPFGPQLQLHADDGVLWPIADGSRGAFIWGAQLTEAAGEQSYIPAADVAASRLKDDATLTMVQPAACTIVADIIAPPRAIATRHQAMIGTANNYLPLFFNFGQNQLRTYSQYGEDLLASATPTPGQPYRAAISYGAGQTIACGTGAPAATVLAKAAPDLSTLVFGNRPGQDAALGSYIRKVLIFDRAFSAAEVLAAVEGVR